MSGLMHKVKDALSGEKNTPEAASANQGSNEYGHTPSSNLTHGGIGQSSASGDRTTHTGYGTDSTNAGPHSSNAGNKMDPRVDSDLDGSNRHGHGTTGSGLTGSHNTGTTGSGLTGSHNTGTTGSGLTGGSGYGSSGYDNTTGHSTTAGPHSSNLANKADPRVDSDRDGSNRHDHGTTGSGLTGSNTSGTGYGGSSGYGSTAGGSSNVGPHSSNLANKADPRVDSDLDSSRGTTGSGLTGSGTGHHGHHGGVTGKVDDLVHGGEHHTETANRLDPHVSGGRGPLEHTSVGGSGSGLGSSTATHGTGSTGGYGSSNTTAGPHSSNLANKADPRVDSDRDGSRGYGSSTGQSGVTGGYGSSAGTTAGYGSSDTTAGPHSSNLANKADPRVDSDRDGSRGYGSSTGQSGHSGTTGGYGSSTGTTGGYGSNTGTGYGDNTTGTTGKKPGLMDKLNPMKDTDGDGKKGLME
ncbi:MAG: hypothetical protein L6R40_005746 [Gallowayella cf. fulva]|nr:MAG: hypothetical protein L6R40_005746 [Xanthomendoza cf. fulva]